MREETLPARTRHGADSTPAGVAALMEEPATPTGSVDQQAIGKQVGSSALWSALNAGTLRVATFLVTLFMVRLVAPYEFGVFTVALTVFSIVMSIAELGVSSAIVREHNRSREIAPTVFTISLINAAVLALLMVLFASPIARELGAANAAAAVRVLSLVVLLSGISAVPEALLMRDFMQRQQFFANAAYFVASTVVMLALVLLGHPIMGLAFSRVAGQLVTVILIVWIAPERYWPGFRPAEAKRLLTFGLPLAGANLLTFAIASLDFIVVGHCLGARQLGYYNLAFNISAWPLMMFSAVLIRVTLPTLSRVRESGAKLTEHLTAGLSAIAALSFPVCALLAALSGPLIDTVYGARWHSAWVALVVLAVFGAARTVLQLFSDLTIALGLTRRLLLIQVFWLLMLTPTMILCVGWWHIAGAGIAHAVVVMLLPIPLYLITIQRNTPVGLAWIWGAIGRPLFASVCSAAIAYMSTLLTSAEAAKLLVGLGTGLLTYILLAGRWLYGLQLRLRRMYWRPPRLPRHALIQCRDKDDTERSQGARK